MREKTVIYGVQCIQFFSDKSASKPAYALF